MSKHRTLTMWPQFWGSPQSQITQSDRWKEVRSAIHVTQASKKTTGAVLCWHVYIISSYFTSFSLISHSFFLKLAVNEKGMSKTYQRGSFWNDIFEVFKRSDNDAKKDSERWWFPCFVNPGVIRTTPKMQADDKLPWSKYSTEMHCKIRYQCKYVDAW